MINFNESAFARNRWLVGVNADPNADASEIHREIWEWIEAHAKRHRKRWERYEQAHSLHECEQTDAEIEVQPC